jgi:hypothetical protein
VFPDTVPGLFRGAIEGSKELLVTWHGKALRIFAMMITTLPGSGHVAKREYSKACKVMAQCREGTKSLTRGSRERELDFALAQLIVMSSGSVMLPTN